MIDDKRGRGGVGVAGFGGDISGLFVFLLIAVFAVFSLLLVLIGSNAYRGIVDNAEQNARLRTSLSYIASKVRACDAADAVTVERRGGASVLLLNQAYEDGLYQTRIYALRAEEGVGLYELFTKADRVPTLTDGQHIADVAGFDVQAEAEGVRLRVALLDGSEESLFLRQRTVNNE
jgi:hypothetical protein